MDVRRERIMLLVRKSRFTKIMDRLRYRILGPDTPVEKSNVNLMQMDDFEVEEDKENVRDDYDVYKDQLDQFHRDEEREFHHLLTELNITREQYKKAVLEYFLSNMTLEEAFDYLTKFERQYESSMKPQYYYWEYESCMSTKAKVCESLLSNNEPIYKYFYVEDLQGKFEGNYDVVTWWERCRFGIVADTWHNGPYEFCSYEIQYETDDYKLYRSMLHELTIHEICEKYYDKLFHMKEDEIMIKFHEHLS